MEFEIDQCVCDECPNGIEEQMELEFPRRYNMVRPKDHPSRLREAELRKAAEQECFVVFCEGCSARLCRKHLFELLPPSWLVPEVAK